MSSRARRTRATDRPGSRSASAHATPSRHETRVSATSVRSATSRARGDQAVAVGGGVGEAEVVEHGDADEQVAGAPAAAARRATASTHTRTDVAKSPRHAEASHRISPPSPVGWTVVDRLHLVGPGCQLDRVGAAGCDDDQRAQHRSPLAGSAQRSSSGATRSARSWRPRRKKSAGGPHNPAASSPDRSRGREHHRLAPVVGLPLEADGLRSTAALHGSSDGSAGDRRHPVGHGRRASWRSPWASSCSRAKARIVSSNRIAHARAVRRRPRTMLLCTSDSMTGRRRGAAMPGAGDVLAASSSKPPGRRREARNSRCSSGSSRRYDQSIVACIVPWRPVAPRRRRPQQRAWSSRPSRIAATPSVAARAAASSMASGRPSSRRAERLDRRPVAVVQIGTRPPRPAAGTARRRPSAGRQRAHGDDLLAVDPERLAAGRQTAGSGSAVVSASTTAAARVDDVLAVVDDEQRPVRRTRRPWPPPASSRRHRRHRRRAAMASATSSGSVMPAEPDEPHVGEPVAAARRPHAPPGGSCRRRRHR